MSSDNDGDGIWGILLNTWWGQLLMAAFFVVLAVLLYRYIDNAESALGEGRFYLPLAVVYSIAGKWGCVLLVLLPAAIFGYFGIRNVVVQIQDRHEE